MVWSAWGRSFPDINPIIIGIYTNTCLNTSAFIVILLFTLQLLKEHEYIDDKIMVWCYKIFNIYFSPIDVPRLYARVSFFLAQSTDCLKNHKNAIKYIDLYLQQRDENRLSKLSVNLINYYYILHLIMMLHAYQCRKYTQFVLLASI